MHSLFVFGNVSNQTGASLVSAHHGAGLVGLSLLVAFASCSAAFYMAHINRQATTLSHRRVSLLCASMVLGLGIWAMHFIGMLAMQLPAQLTFGITGSALSIIPGILAAWLALRSLQTEHPSNRRIAASGALVGLGIAAMHYSGIYAIELDGQIVFDLPLFMQSLILGIVFSVLAFAAHRWINRSSRLPRYWRLLPPALMTAAMASMHYLSMHGLRLIVNTDSLEANTARAALKDNHTLSFVIAAMAAAIFLFFGLANALLRYRDLWQAVAIRDARLNAMLETTPDGVITINVQGLVQDFNPAAEQIFGYTKEEVIGHNISMLMPSPLAEQHDGHLYKHWGKPDKAIASNGREVLGKHKDGRHVPLQLAIGKALTPSGTIFVGYLQDISDRKRTDAQLRIAASVFEHVREGVAIVDAHHNISDVNPAFLRLMEKEREDCAGQSLESLYEHADIPPDMSKLWQTVAARQYWQNEIMFTRQNGTVWMQRLSISPVLNELKRPHHFIAVISDVSERPGLEAILSYADLHDSATGLPSHKLFMDRLGNSLLAARNHDTHLGVVLIKTVSLNTPAMQPQSTDWVGALRLLAQLLHQQQRSSDTLARFGDDQLALLLPGIKDAKSLRTLVQRLKESLSMSDVSYTKYGIGEIQIGYTSTLQSQGTASELLVLATDDMVPLSLQNKPLTL